MTNRSRRTSSPIFAISIVILFAIIGISSPSQATAIYDGSFTVQLEITEIESSLSGTLTSVPLDLIIEAQTEGDEFSFSSGAASASVGGGQNVISSGAPVGNGPASIVDLRDGFLLELLVSGDANQPNGFATSSTGRAGAISFENMSTNEIFTGEALLSWAFDLLATTDLQGEESLVGFVLAVVVNDALPMFFEETVSSPSEFSSGSNQLAIPFEIVPDGTFGIGVGAGLGGTASVPEPATLVLFFAGLVGFVLLKAIGTGTIDLRA